jgi:hypothetical protein
VHQLSIGIQRELLWGFAGEARYVGTFGRDIWRGLDLNQMNIPQAFLDDFLRARSNGYLAVGAGKAFDVRYDPTVSGSKPLTYLPQFGENLLSNSTLRGHFQTGEVGNAADFYLQQRLALAYNTFLPNPAIYEARAWLNDAWQDYNALQLELRRQYRNGIMGTINYTYARQRANSVGAGSQSRYEAYMDNKRPELDTGRANADIRHVVNSTLIVELPFGQGKKWLNQGGLSNAILGGWQTSAIVRYQSGAPIGIYSGRGTINRSGRSGNNTAVTSLTKEQLQQRLGVVKMADGRIFWFDPSLIDAATGRAVGPDNLTNGKGFDSQVFFHPMAGEVGNLPLLLLDGPKVFSVDGAISKRLRITGRYNLEVRGEFFNLFNGVQFSSGDLSINSTTFGRITGTTVGARVVQLTGRIDF